MKKWGINKITILTPDEVLREGGVAVSGDRIQQVSTHEIKAPFSLDMEEAILLPGLINAHDHLLGTYYPKVGNGPYENWLPWDNDLKSSPVYEERQQIENRDLYLLGAYRNLVSGVTTVSDHIPHFVNDPYIDILPVKAIRDYALAHSITSFALAWGDGIEVEYKKALKEDIPFVTHIAEGFDGETVMDVRVLDKRGGLGDHSVLVHGLAFSDEDIKLIKERGASVVWCADSNMFMYDRTANIKQLLKTGVNVCIGTDSPMSGGLNLLYEMKFNKALYYNLYGEELPDETIVRMVTTNPARAFRLKKTGVIKSGNVADFIVINKKDDSPYTSLLKTELKDVMLVVMDGKPAYGDARFRSLFDELRVPCQKIVLAGKEKVVVGDLAGLLKRISRAVGFKKEFPFLPVEFDM